MRTRISLLAAVAASLAVLAPQDARAAVWTFTKSGGGWTSHALAAPAARVDAMTFTVSAVGVAPSRVTRMAFLVTGTVLGGDVVNYDLVYYPAGLAGPGVVVGSNTGSSFSPGPRGSMVAIDLLSPIDVVGTFAGDFVLQATVSGGRTFSFQPTLRTVTVESGGVERFLLDTEDLPLPGDSFRVN